MKLRSSGRQNEIKHLEQYEDDEINCHLANAKLNL